MSNPFFINIKRIVRSGFFGFWRNTFVTLSAILIMTVTLFVIGSTIFSSAILGTTLNQIKDKVDINVYFVNGAPENDIFSIKKRLENLPEVLPPVEYVSQEDALAAFKLRHQNDQITLQAIDELGVNPLGAVLNIKAKDPSQYSSIADFLKDEQSQSTIIDKINYYQNKDAIDRLSKIISAGKKLGSILTAILIIISIMITFNTIRLVIYMSKDEISVMRLVGASTGYIRGPFFVAGAIYGAVSSIITLVLFYPITIWIGNTTSNFLGGMNIFDYYTSNFGQIFLILLGSGVAIGAISSFLAVRKYLKV